MLPKSVLIVDDENIVLEVLSRSLTKDGFAIQTASTGEEAIRNIQQTRPDVIISDVMMSEMDGFEFCHRVRERLDCQLIPFIFLTCRDNISDKLGGLEMGADYYLTKPVDVSELSGIVQRAIRRNELVFRLSDIDPLTGIYNRRHFDKRIQEEFQRSKRYNSDLTVAMVDIDHFKNVNDEYGHLAGDFILQSLAKFIKNQLRESDVFCRFGGEEFMILMTETPVKNGLPVMERIKNDLAETIHHFPLDDVDLRITISAGINMVENQTKSVQELLENVDKALYISKNSGRNRVTLYQQNN
jgi:diguanylate cyclase (GGDEF)-like protein